MNEQPKVEVWIKMWIVVGILVAAGLLIVLDNVINMINDINVGI